ncbi:Por secretion system C-terminal sorting domain-containing protein [Marivirga sericea]|uniref:Por secretion system C-terminal sorting domain-containing protein n=1 Tax=Marivirga sericea TaxID=1028 RepID=A0A1X7I755_9BACT|nr:T9SS type A sorting domain-containing protein [Marivirga sericea]SMG10349.1 Por secretion system C-terminal sorting domain-containing protein [Marivirga sericea]
MKFYYKTLISLSLLFIIRQANVLACGDIQDAFISGPTTIPIQESSQFTMNMTEAYKYESPFCPGTTEGYQSTTWSVSSQNNFATGETVNINPTALGLQLGQYQLTGFNDYGNPQCDATYSKNITVAAPDLTIASPSLSGSSPVYNSNATYTINVRARNRNSVRSLPTSAKIYFSTNSSYSSNDFFAGEVNIPAISANSETSNINVNITTPSITFSPSYFYIIIVINQSQQIIESTYANNSDDYSVTVQNSGGRFLTNDISIYPNPSKDRFNIDSNGKNIQNIIVVDDKGNEVYRQNVNSNKKLIENINISSLKPGNYIIRSYTDDNQVINKKIVVE